MVAANKMFDTCEKYRELLNAFKDVFYVECENMVEFYSKHKTLFEKDDENNTEK